jgi:hypothetical protein
MDPELQRRARKKAAELGVSFAEYVRRVVAQDLGEAKPQADVSIIFDLGASVEPTNVARDKDKLLGDAAWEEYLEETGRRVMRRIHRRAAENFWAGIRRGAAEVVTVLPVDFDVAWSVTHDFPDQKFSIVDRTSFAVMERLGLTRVASFDNDFAVYRYGRKRDRAFEVLR